MVFTFEVDRALGLKMHAVATLRGCSLAAALRKAIENEVLGWEDTPGYHAALAAAADICTPPPRPVSPSSRLDPVHSE